MTRRRNQKRKGLLMRTAHARSFQLRRKKKKKEKI